VVRDILFSAALVGGWFAGDAASTLVTHYHSKADPISALMEAVFLLGLVALYKVGPLYVCCDGVIWVCARLWHVRAVVLWRVFAVVACTAAVIAGSIQFSATVRKAATSGLGAASKTSIMHVSVARMHARQNENPRGN
jgi:hypothetical protein